ncbi:MAG: hypothetical protein IPM61_00990 [Chlorobi bacterium]|nr:hypothetical protein [Chlorobiota bacterium]MBX7215635.1 hypothetical protein [Candidatus Kapabacteria bacterium]
MTAALAKWESNPALGGYNLKLANSVHGHLRLDHSTVLIQVFGEIGLMLLRQVAINHYIIAAAYKIHF